jgi:hypothetical protein
VSSRDSGELEVSFPQVELGMWRARRRIQPTIPHSVEEAIELLEMNEFLQRSGADDEVVYAGHSQNGEDFAMFFAHPKLLDELAMSSRIFADGTFRVVPRIFYQLLTVGFCKQ